jgi:hypothetical protein
MPSFFNMPREVRSLVYDCLAADGSTSILPTRKVPLTVEHTLPPKGSDIRNVSRQLRVEFDAHVGRKLGLYTPTLRFTLRDWNAIGASIRDARYPALRSYVGPLLYTCMGAYVYAGYATPPQRGRSMINQMIRAASSTLEHKVLTSRHGRCSFDLLQRWTSSYSARRLPCA